MTTCIALCCDEAYIRPLTVAVSSLAQFHSRPETIAIAQVGLEGEDRRRVERAAKHHRVHWMDVDLEPTAGAKLPDHLPPAALFRLFLPELLPDEFDRFVYLDTDVLARADLTALLDFDLEGASTAAVRDPWIGSFGSLNGPPHVELGIEPETPYFNSGVLVVDRKRWRADAIADRALGLLRKHALPYADQCALNTVLDQGWVRLDPRWNTQPSHATAKCHFESPEEAAAISRAIESPGIVHFVGPKPWQQLNVAGSDLWFEQAEQTEYAGRRPAVAEHVPSRWGSPAQVGRSALRQVLGVRQFSRLQALRSSSSSLDAGSVDEIERRTGGRVQAGPFAGMALPDTVTRPGARLPRLLGSFEQELHGVLEEIRDRDPAVIHTFGDETGFYSIGFARLVRAARVRVHGEPDSDRAPLRASIVSSGMEAQIDIVTRTEENATRSGPGGVSSRSEVWFIDGGALPEQLDVDLQPPLAIAFMVVACDEGRIPGVTGTLARRFSDTHDIEMIERGARNPAAIRSIARWDERRRWLAIDEGKPGRWHWLVLRPREAST